MRGEGSPGLFLCCLACGSLCDALRSIFASWYFELWGLDWIGILEERLSHSCFFGLRHGPGAKMWLRIIQNTIGTNGEPITLLEY